MVETIFLDGSAIRETGTLRLRLDRQIQINVLAEEVRQLVNQFVHREISTQMHAEVPMLTVSTKNEAEWHLPIHLAFPAFGDVGSLAFYTLIPSPAVLTPPPPSWQN